MNTKTEKMRLWKTTGTFATFNDADKERNSLIADGLKVKVRNRNHIKFDVKVCVKEVE